MCLGVCLAPPSRGRLIQSYRGNYKLISMLIYKARGILPRRKGQTSMLHHSIGTKPSQAAKSRPLRKVTMAGAKASIAMALIDPMPGMDMRRTLRFR